MMMEKIVAINFVVMLHEDPKTTFINAFQNLNFKQLGNLRQPTLVVDLIVTSARYVCLLGFTFVGLSVSKISQNVVDEFLRKVLEGWGASIEKNPILLLIRLP